MTRRACNLVSIVALLASCAWLPAQAAAKQPATLALLVGIGDYAKASNGDALVKLDGPANDVARARDVLMRRFHFEPSTIKTLVGAEATHEAIVQAFYAHLVQQAGPDTHVVFWFAGHGSRIPDASRHDAGERELGEHDVVYDSTLLAWDSRAVDANGSYDITDDELHSLLQALRAKDVVVVTDCCHSGGALRGSQQSGVRSGNDGTAPLDVAKIKAFWPLPNEPVDDDVETRLPNVVHIAACRTYEEAREWCSPAGTYGCLTWFLAGVLEEVDAPTAWRDVTARVCARVLVHGTQVVNASGAVERSILGGIGRPAPGGFQALELGTKDLWIGGGALHGLGVGAEFRLLGFDGTEVGRAVSTRVRPEASFAAWVKRPERFDPALRAEVVSFGNGAAKLRVAVTEGVDAPLADCPVAQIVADARDADVVLARDGSKLVLKDPGGQILRAIAGDVGNELLKEHRFRWLWSGVAAVGRQELRVRVEQASVEDAARFQLPRARVLELADGRGAIVGVDPFDKDGPGNGGLFTLCVDNRSDEPLYIAILSVMATREVNVVQGKDRSSVLGPGQTLRKTIVEGSDPSWRGTLVDRLVVIGTTSFVDFAPFASRDPRPEATRGGDAMPPFLREALSGSRGPAGKVDWGITSCDVRVVSPAAVDLLLAQQDLERRRWLPALQRLSELAGASVAERERAAVLLAKARAGLQSATGPGGAGTEKPAKSGK